jgi:hypothetical protein
MKNLEEINGHAKRVSEVMAEIAAASDQQSQGVGQVNTAMEQMNQLTQAERRQQRRVRQRLRRAERPGPRNARHGLRIQNQRRGPFGPFLQRSTKGVSGSSKTALMKVPAKSKGTTEAFPLEMFPLNAESNGNGQGRL